MIGMRSRILMVALATAGMTIGYATPAAAQATRTWVSGVGDDVNPCSRTAPCKTFAGAISKTAAGGEINCLDPGGFGAVTITKSMTIACPYTEGGALAGGNGIIVNDACPPRPTSSSSSAASTSSESIRRPTASASSPAPRSTSRIPSSAASTRRTAPASPSSRAAPTKLYITNTTDRRKRQRRAPAAES